MANHMTNGIFGVVDVALVIVVVLLLLSLHVTIGKATGPKGNHSIRVNTSTSIVCTYIRAFDVGPLLLYIWTQFVQLSVRAHDRIGLRLNGRQWPVIWYAKWIIMWSHYGYYPINHYSCYGTVQHTHIDGAFLLLLLLLQKLFCAQICVLCSSHSMRMEGG